jgi:hypothetical protein
MRIPFGSLFAGTDWDHPPPDPAARLKPGDVLRPYEDFWHLLIVVGVVVWALTFVLYWRWRRRLRVSIPADEKIVVFATRVRCLLITVGVALGFVVRAWLLPKNWTESDSGLRWDTELAICIFASSACCAVFGQFVVGLLYPGTVNASRQELPPTLPRL